MAAATAQAGLEEMERQRDLISNCTALWRELTDHFAAVERRLQSRSESLLAARADFNASAERTLAALHRRETTIEASVDLAVSKAEHALSAALQAASSSPPPPPSDDLGAKLVSLCSKMDGDGFFDAILSRKKEAGLLHAEIPSALAVCIDPATFVLDSISNVFPINCRGTKDNCDCGWACVVVLESLVPVLADPDPEIGESRHMVTPSVRERAKKVAKEWMDEMVKRGGVDVAKPGEVHTFLQLLVTFGIVDKEEREFYKKLVVGFAWRKQMPKIAISLGLMNKMSDIIEELIDKGRQLDAINFSCAAGFQDKYPPISLLKSYLKDFKKTPSSILEHRNNNGQGVHNAISREQAAIRAVIKCISYHKLEAEFSPESLLKRLEQLEKTKIMKKKPSGNPAAPASKRTRANNGGPMPPAKAGRLTNNTYPVAPTYVRSPSHSPYSPVAPPTYAYEMQMSHDPVFGSLSPPAIRDPYGYSTEEMPSPGLAAPLYHTPPIPTPINYPAYGGYTCGFFPGYQQGYYR